MKTLRVDVQVPWARKVASHLEDSQGGRQHGPYNPMAERSQWEVQTNLP